MEWFVYCFNHTKNRVEPYNIFKHSGFVRDMYEALINFSDDRKAFEEQLRKNAQYYFWSRCEYEVVLIPWPNGGEHVKVDIYDQLCMNWDNFVDYIWRNQ